MAARLSALGLTPVTTHHDGYAGIDVYVPRTISREQWQELLAVLTTADHFGLVDSSEDGRSAWAGVNKNPRSGARRPGAWPSASRS
ncbi:hypothetical protein AB0N09_28895 [Streptomyces erythrochromogenes]|uniref:hypothetical protein n=1 Tax=Streptomyces erythrochromogenes TaxID=285574 RepID=UPI003424A4C5